MKYEYETLGDVAVLGLFFIFLTLKLVGTITWSWWWVTAPIWIPFGAATIVVVVYILYACLKIAWERHH